ncbi:MAG: protein disulfide oxidoreductase [Gammaproteobacteria bacterium]|jgi:peroxiredoxin|nr:protein disulfide oxidoreductase [Gammaproteobacteria bacterium]
MVKLKQLRKIRSVRLAFDIALVFLVFIAVKTYMQRHLVEGAAPPIEGRLLTGELVNLQTYQGQPVLVYFWATWCPVCKLEQNAIDSISKNHTVVSIAMNSGNAIEVNTYLQENNLNFPVIVDEYGDIAKQFGVRGVPTSFIIDAEGNIAFSEMGYTTGWGLRLRLWMAGE